MPAPTGWRSSSGLVSELGLIIAPERPDITAGRVASGLLRCSSTVCGSTTTTSAMLTSSGARVEPSMVLERSMFALTAAASKTAPSWNVTSGRRWNVSTMPSSEYSQDSASPGISEASGAVCTSRS